MSSHTTAGTTSTNTGVVSSVIDSNQPYYLHPSDHPGFMEMVEIRELSDYDSPPPRYKSWLDELPFLHSYVPDQGETSTCTSHAITFAVSILHINESQRFSDLPGDKEAQDGVMPSQWVLSPQAPVDRVPILYAGRVVDDTYREDARGTAGLRCHEIYEYGVDFGFTFKDSFNDRMRRNPFNSVPSSHEVPRVHIEDFQQMGRCVGANRVPIFKAIDKQALVGLLDVTQPFIDCKHIYRKNTAEVKDCHAVAIVGYDAEWNLLQIYNSWGEFGVCDRLGSLWVEADLLFGISRPLKSSLYAGPVDFSTRPRPRHKLPFKYNIGWGESELMGYSEVDKSFLKSLDLDEPIQTDAPAPLLTLENQVSAAISNSCRAPHCTLLAKIARDTDTAKSRATILYLLVRVVNMPLGRNRGSLFKTLVLLKYLVGNGSAAMVFEILDRSSHISEKVRQRISECTCSRFALVLRMKLDELMVLLSDSASLDSARADGAYSRTMYFTFRDSVRLFGFN